MLLTGALLGQTQALGLPADVGSHIAGGGQVALQLSPSRSDGESLTLVLLLSGLPPFHRKTAIGGVGRILAVS